MGFWRSQVPLGSIDWHQVTPVHLHGVAEESRDQRDPFLDLLRATAVVRVVVWHVLAAAFITYIWAAVPAIVFVSASLLTRSLARRPARAVLRDRFRRLLVPYWLYLACVASVLAVVEVTTHQEALPRWGALTWLFPVVDPVSTQFEQGWLTSALWYVRLMCWVLIGTALLRRVAQRHPVSLIVSLVGLLGLSEVLLAQAEVTSQLGRVWWYLGDVALYGLFCTLGILHGSGRLEGVSPKRWWALTAAFSTGAAVWCVLVPPPGGVVNDAHVALGLVGAAWLCLALALRTPLVRVALKPRVARVTSMLNRRSLSIYLVQSPAIVLAYGLVDRARLHGWVKPIAALVLTAALIAVLCALFGIAEDLAARRPIRIGASLPRVAVSIVVLTVVVPLAVTHSGPSSLQQLTAPSRQPYVVFSEQDPELVTEAPRPALLGDLMVAPSNPAIDAALTERLGALVDELGIDGATLTAVRPNLVSTTVSAGSPPEELVRAWSVTKMSVAATSFWLHERALVDLDAPLAPLWNLEDPWALGGVTLRQLLGHRVSLVDYHELNPQSDPVPELELANRVLRASVPEALEVREYNSSGYLLTGVAISALTGRHWSDWVRDVVIDPLGLTHTFLGTFEQGYYSYASGSMMSTTEDISRITAALLRDYRIISPMSVGLMGDIDGNGLGVGLFGYCPCQAGDGFTRYGFVGHPGNRTRTVYVASVDTIVTLELSDSQWESDERMEAIQWAIVDFVDIVNRAIDPTARSLRAPTSGGGTNTQEMPSQDLSPDGGADVVADVVTDSETAVDQDQSVTVDPGVTGDAAAAQVTTEQVPPTAASVEPVFEPSRLRPWAERH